MKKGIQVTFKHGLNKGIHLSPSEMNNIMWSSVLQVLLTRLHLTKECMIYSFTPINLEFVKELITMPA